MKKIFIVLMFVLLCFGYVYGEVLNGDSYAERGLLIPLDALTTTDSTDVIQFNNKLLETVSFWYWFIDIDDSTSVYFEGSPDNSHWANLDSDGASIYTSVDSSYTYMKTFRDLSSVRYIRVRVAPDAGLNMDSAVSAGF